jgi:hypothetical protein
VKLLAPLLACLLLAACGGAYTPTPRALSVYIAQATQDVSLAQTQKSERVTATAQAIVFRATQTAGAVQAQAQQTALAHQNIITATQDAAQVQMTRNSITATMQSLTGTEIALNKVSATETVAAKMWPTAARATSEALYTAADNARTDSDTHRNLGWILSIASGAVAFFVAGFVGLACGELISARIETFRHECAMHRSEEDQQNARNAMTWADVEAKMPAQPVADETQEWIRQDQWKTQLEIFFKAGDVLGFSNSALCPKVISNADWTSLTAHLVEVCHVLQRDGKDRNTTKWAPDYDLSRALEDLDSGAIRLPPGRPVNVKWASNSGRGATFQTVKRSPEGGL